MVSNLGSVESSEKLITDLYIDLRRRINIWASVTKQTPQARMGYVGQHLVSIVTGYPGGRSGARGRDLIISPNEYGEIKTCYRVDQLGKCGDCGAGAASIEEECSECGSKKITRKDDSKWLISIRHQDEYAIILEPKIYYLVLFDFTDMQKPDTVRASIWSVNPTDPGFAFCMIDYFENIRSKSTSKAPFNFWPFSIKFDLMHPKLIYRSFIFPDDTIKTEIFPSRDAPIESSAISLSSYANAKNLTPDKLLFFARRLGMDEVLLGKKKTMIESLDKLILDKGLSVKTVIDALAYALYWEDVAPHISGLPIKLRDQLFATGLIEQSVGQSELLPTDLI